MKNDRIIDMNDPEFRDLDERLRLLLLAQEKMTDDEILDRFIDALDERIQNNDEQLL